MKIKASPRLEDDVLAWGPERFGMFSVKTAYDLAFEEAHRGSLVASTSNPLGSRRCWKDIWSCGVPPTVKFFAWRLAKTLFQLGKTNTKFNWRFRVYVPFVQWSRRTIFILCLTARSPVNCIWPCLKCGDYRPRSRL